MSSRELTGRELVEISSSLAKWASDGRIDYTVILAKLDLSPINFQVNQAPKNLWFEITKAIHAGSSRTAGFCSNAVARLVKEIAEELQGNLELVQLAYRLGNPGPIHAKSSAKPIIFLSYATANQSEVDQLYSALGRGAVQVKLFQDHKSIPYGEKWLDEIRETASRSSILVAWLTHDYLKSAFCSYEVGVAESCGSKIIPILIEPSARPIAPAYLSQRQMISSISTTPDYDALANQILASLIK